MPQVLIALVVGAGLMAGARWVARSIERASEAQRRHEAERRAADARARQRAGRPRDQGTLELDPETGVYRPRKD